jgi:2-dehydro-3-deoxygalactonokinase
MVRAIKAGMASFRKMLPAQFLSCDWGTTSFRLRLMDVASGAVVQEVQSESGARTILAQKPDATAAERGALFAECLREHLAKLPPFETPTALIISGMASSSVGWHEVPYGRTPFPLDGSGVMFQEFPFEFGEGKTVQVCLLCGVRGEGEVMRGEETEILGLFRSALKDMVAEKLLLVLPGTHSKHVCVEKGAIQSFQTFMTGELFDVLATHSLLRASVGGDLKLENPEAARAFGEGVDAGRNRGLAASLFRVRTRAVLDAVPADANRWYLSGLLIGSELAYLATPGRPIVLAAPAATSEPYEQACSILGIPCRTIPPSDLTLASSQGHRFLLERFLDLGKS